jgi:hypothetical protein
MLIVRQVHLALSQQASRGEHAEPIPPRVQGDRDRRADTRREITRDEYVPVR